MAKVSLDRSARAEARSQAIAVSPQDVSKAAPTKQAGNKVAITATIKDIKVCAVELEPKSAKYLVTLNSSSKRITIKTNKKVWEAGEDAFSVMMDKSRRAIFSKKDEWKEDLSLRVDVAVGREFMYGKEWPWKYLWSEVQREMSKQKVLSLGRIASSSKGHETREEALQSTEWERGPGYNNTEKDSKAMRRAKNAVISAVEKGSKKNITKAEVILSEVVLELSEAHGLTAKSSARKSIIDGAAIVIKHLSRSQSILAAKLLTGRVSYYKFF